MFFDVINESWSTCRIWDPDLTGSFCFWIETCFFSSSPFQSHRRPTAYRRSPSFVVSGGWMLVELERQAICRLKPPLIFIHIFLSTLDAFMIRLWHQRRVGANYMLFPVQRHTYESNGHTCARKHTFDSKCRHLIQIYWSLSPTGKID